MQVIPYSACFVFASVSYKFNPVFLTAEERFGVTISRIWFRVFFLSLRSSWLISQRNMLCANNKVTLSII